MRSVTIWIMAAALAVLSLAGCDGTNSPSGTPGSATVSLHGRVESDVGTSWH